MSTADIIQMDWLQDKIKEAIDNDQEIPQDLMERLEDLLHVYGLDGKFNNVC